MWVLEDFNNNGCPGGGWSIVTSSASNSQLASVLAGFIFTGILLLVDRRRSSRNTQALGLFSATLVVLGFCSYLFSLVSGGTADKFCKRVWAEGMAASGGLGVGGFALITGVCWLLAAHAEALTAPSAEPPGQRPAKQGDGPLQEDAGLALDRFASVMIIGAAVGVMLLLAMTSNDYLQVALGSQDSGAKVAISQYISPGLPIAIVIITALAGLTRLRTSSTSRFARGVRPFAIYGAMLYGIAAPVLAGLFTAFPDTVWNNDRPTPWWILTAALGVGLVLPAVLVVAIVHATPRIGTASAPIRSHRGRSHSKRIAGRVALRRAGLRGTGGSQ